MRPGILWIAFAVAIVISASVRMISRSTLACPKCGHPKTSHVPAQIDGVLLRPLKCSVCGAECNW